MTIYTTSSPFGTQKKNSGNKSRFANYDKMILNYTAQKHQAHSVLLRFDVMGFPVSAEAATQLSLFSTGTEHLFEMISTEDHAKLHKVMRGLKVGKPSTSESLRIKMDDGSLELHHCAFYPELNTLGTLKSFLLHIHSIEMETQQKAELENDVAFYRTISDQMPGRIMITDENSVLLFMNAAASADPEFMRAAAASQYLDRDNGILKTPIMVDRMKCFLLTTDTTTMDTKETLINSSKTNDQPLAANDLRVFTTAASHDLRSPLRTINGFASDLEANKNELDPEVLAHHLAVIKYQTVHMGILMDRMLAYTAIGNKIIEPEKVNLSVLLTEICNEQASKLGRTFTIQIEQENFIVADIYLIQILFRELITNTMRFTAEQTASTIRFTLEKQQEGYRCTLEDNSIGFDTAKTERLFEPLQKFHADNNDQGSGMGLAMAKKIITMHHGEISLFSSPGKGMKVVFTINTSSK